ncbi:hypothetical protein Tco_0563631 [Tanacetum coccineum]
MDGDDLLGWDGDWDWDWLWDYGGGIWGFVVADSWWGDGIWWWGMGCGIGIARWDGWGDGFGWIGIVDGIFWVGDGVVWGFGNLVGDGDDGMIYNWGLGWGMIWMGLGLGILGLSGDGRIAGISWDDWWVVGGDQWGIWDGLGLGYLDRMAGGWGFYQGHWDWWWVGFVGRDGVGMCVRGVAWGYHGRELSRGRLWDWDGDGGWGGGGDWGLIGGVVGFSGMRFGVGLVWVGGGIFPGSLFVDWIGWSLEMYGWGLGGWCCLGSLGGIGGWGGGRGGVAGMDLGWMGDLGISPSRGGMIMGLGGIGYFILHVLGWIVGMGCGWGWDAFGGDGWVMWDLVGVGYIKIGNMLVDLGWWWDGGGRLGDHLGGWGRLAFWGDFGMGGWCLSGMFGIGIGGLGFGWGRCWDIKSLGGSRSGKGGGGWSVGGWGDGGMFGIYLGWGMDCGHIGDLCGVWGWDGVGWGLGMGFGCGDGIGMDWGWDLWGSGLVGYGLGMAVRGEEWGFGCGVDGMVGDGDLGWDWGVGTEGMGLGGIGMWDWRLGFFWDRMDGWDIGIWVWDFFVLGDWGESEAGEGVDAWGFGGGMGVGIGMGFPGGRIGFWGWGLGGVVLGLGISGLGFVVGSGGDSCGWDVGGIGGIVGCMMWGIFVGGGMGRGGLGFGGGFLGGENWNGIAGMDGYFWDIDGIWGLGWLGDCGGFGLFGGWDFGGMGLWDWGIGIMGIVNGHRGGSWDGLWGMDVGWGRWEGDDGGIWVWDGIGGLGFGVDILGTIRDSEGVLVISTTLYCSLLTL